MFFKYTIQEDIVQLPSLMISTYKLSTLQLKTVKIQYTLTLIVSVIRNLLPSFFVILNTSFLLRLNLENKTIKMPSKWYLHFFILLMLIEVKNRCHIMAGHNETINLLQTRNGFCNFVSAMLNVGINVLRIWGNRTLQHLEVYWLVTLFGFFVLKASDEVLCVGKHGLPFFWPNERSLNVNGDWVVVWKN